MYFAILDDDPIALRQISALLSEHYSVSPQEWNLTPEAEWQIDTYSSHQAFIHGIKRTSYDLVILDWELPESSGIEILHWMQEYFDAPPPTIMVTNRNAESDIAKALQIGADDFVSKPFRAQELLARVLSILRRQQRQAGTIDPSAPFSYGSLHVAPKQKSISINGRDIKLAHQEYRLALLLLRNIDRPVSRTYLYERIWGQEENPLSRTLDVHVYRVKRKLSLTAENGWKLSSVYGYGYRLQRLEPKKGVST